MSYGAVGLHSELGALIAWIFSTRLLSSRYFSVSFRVDDERVGHCWRESQRYAGPLLDAEQFVLVELALASLSVIMITVWHLLCEVRNDGDGRYAVDCW